MKKNLLMEGLCLSRRTQRIIRIMRFTIFAVFLFCMQLSAAVYPQKDVKLSFKMEKIQFSLALEKIEAASGYRFFYNSTHIPLQEMVLLKTTGSQKLTHILKELLDPLKIKYK